MKDQRKTTQRSTGGTPDTATWSVTRQLNFMFLVAAIAKGKLPLEPEPDIRNQCREGELTSAAWGIVGRRRGPSHPGLGRLTIAAVWGELARRSDDDNVVCATIEELAKGSVVHERTCRRVLRWLVAHEFAFAFPLPEELQKKRRGRLSKRRFLWLLLPMPAEVLGRLSPAEYADVVNVPPLPDLDPGYVAVWSRSAEGVLSCSIQRQHTSGRAPSAAVCPHAASPSPSLSLPAVAKEPH